MHQFASEVARVWEIMPKASGSGSIMDIFLDSEMDIWKDCFQCICWGQECTWELKGKYREESQTPLQYFNRDMELSELQREQELAKKGSEMEMEKEKGSELLFLLDELDQTLR